MSYTQIGRSFIGQLFSKAGYHVVFVDISKRLISELNSAKKYQVVIKKDKDKTIWVNNVSGLYFEQTEKIISSIIESGIVVLSVGLNGLKSVCPIIAQAIRVKYQKNSKLKTDLIIAENIRNGDEFVRHEIRKSLYSDFPLDEQVGFIETSLGKMVPIMPKSVSEKNPLTIYVEEYNTLILSQSEFKNSIPDIPGLALKKNMKAWVDRKLFIHNLGHAVSAFVGNCLHPECKYIYEVLEYKNVENYVLGAMREAGKVLLTMYPNDFTEQHIEEHIADLLERFKNKALGDTVFRVGCDLKRKIAHDDRLVQPIIKAFEYNLEYKNILFGLVCSMNFMATNKNHNIYPTDKTITLDFQKSGISVILKKYSNLNPLKYLEFIIKAEKVEEQITIHNRNSVIQHRMFKRNKSRLEPIIYD